MATRPTAVTDERRRRARAAALHGEHPAPRFAHLDKPHWLVINEVTQCNVFAIRIRAKAYVLDVQYEEAFQTDVTERVLKAFQKHHIMPPSLGRARDDGGASAIAAGADLDAATSDDGG